jgi:hypothetical protein
MEPTPFYHTHEYLVAQALDYLILNNEIDTERVSIIEEELYKMSIPGNNNIISDNTQCKGEQL